MIFDTRNILWSKSMDYCNYPKFSDRYVWANSADPDQTAPLFVIPSASFGLIILW